MSVSETPGHVPTRMPHLWLQRASTAIGVALPCGFLLWYLRPSLLLAPTITAGGDTIYHYVAAKYLRDYLLPNWKIVGWMPGNLAGYPLFLFYFPLGFLLIAGLSLVTAFPVAFKLGTVAGTVALPLVTFITLRWVGSRFPAPALGAILTLPFLLNTGNTMWGGNIPSTLAGEFSHSLSLALVVLFQGALYAGVRSRRGAGWCAILFALTGFAHGYGMVIAAGLALFFLAVESDFVATFLYLFRVYAIGGLLLGFWLIPLVANLHYTTGFPIVWTFGSYREIVPVILWPILIAAAMTVGLALWSRRTDKEWLRIVHYLTYPVVLSIVLYFVSPRLNLVDVRFLAFVQYFLAPLAAVGLGRLLEQAPAPARLLAPLVIGIAIIAWIVPQASFIPNWIRWNYEGMEHKPWWRYYIALSSIAMPGGPHSPRVVYEHSSLHDKAGTVRAFEALPLFSGRPTLEGAYMQSSPSSPFIFYIQSELTETPSCPFIPYPCSPFNPGQALAHLELFNVKQVIAVSDKVKGALASHPGYRQEVEVGPYKVFEVRQGNGQYVVPLAYRPAVAPTPNWKRLAYDWFRKPEWLDVPLVFTPRGEPPPPDAVPFRGLEDEPVKRPFATRCAVKDAIGNEEVRFETDCPGRPHLIKISYHPKWRVEGAERIYLVSPAFMLVYPEERHVRLVFGTRWPDHAGQVATGTGLLWLVAERLVLFTRKRYSDASPAKRMTLPAEGGP
jgi:hypothetical protein